VTAFSLPVAFQRSQAASLQQKDLFYFLWQMFDVLHKDRGEAFVSNWHLQAMCWQLSKVATGDTRRLLITIPPRHRKTITTSVAFVAWLIGRDPALRIIIASYGHALSQKNLVDLRRVMESPAYQRLFPHVAIHVAGPEIRTSRGGSIRATSVGGTITGIGADYIIGDDLLKAGDAKSPQIREEAFNFYQHSLLSRLDNKSEGRIILVQQRLHADDVAGRLLEMGGFTHLNLPAIAEEDELIEIAANVFHHRRVDDVLFPQREPREVLDELRAAMGSEVFVPQYQQRTDGAGSDLFQWSWFDTYAERPLREEFNMIVQSVDIAYADGMDNDWSVCLTFGRRDQDWYLLDVLRTRDSYSDFKASVARLAKRWKTDFLIVEGVGAGITLNRELSRETNLRRSLFLYTPRMSKSERFTTQIERLKHGKFLVPEEATWLQDFRRELISFPNGKHDDQVDAMTQFLDWLGHRVAIAAQQRRDNPRWR
jgi:predicted phage terminase large subunit-like protein